VLISAPPGKIVSYEFQTALRQRAHRDVSDGGAHGAVLHLSHRAPTARQHRTLNPKPSSDLCICRIGRQPRRSTGPETPGPRPTQRFSQPARSCTTATVAKRSSCEIVVPALSAIPVARFVQHRRATSPCACLLALEVVVAADAAIPIPSLKVLELRAAKAAGAPPAEEHPLGNQVVAPWALPCAVHWHLLGPSCVRSLCRTGGPRLSVMFPPAPRGKSPNPFQSLTLRGEPASSNIMLNPVSGLTAPRRGKPLQAAAAPQSAQHV
jgi:hypothetical protein